jgi:hypothetical protein
MSRGKIRDIILIVIALVLTISLVSLIADTGASHSFGGSGTESSTMTNYQVQTHEGDGLLVSFMLVKVDDDSDPYWYANGGIIREANRLAGLGENFNNRPRAKIDGVEGANIDTLAGKYTIALGPDRYGLYKGDRLRMQAGVSYEGSSAGPKHVDIMKYDVYGVLGTSAEVAVLLDTAAQEVSEYANILAKVKERSTGTPTRDLITGFTLGSTTTPEYVDMRKRLGPVGELKEDAFDDGYVLNAIAWQVVLLNASISENKGASELISVRDYLVRVLEAGVSGDMSSLVDAPEWSVTTLFEPIVWYSAHARDRKTSWSGTPLQLAKLIWDNKEDKGVGGQVWFEVRRQVTAGSNSASPMADKWYYTGPVPEPDNPLIFTVDGETSYDTSRTLKFGESDVKGVGDMRAGWSSFYVPVFDLKTKPKVPKIDVIRLFDEMDELGNVVNRVLIDGGNQHIKFESVKLSGAPYFLKVVEAEYEKGFGANLENDRKYSLVVEEFGESVDGEEVSTGLVTVETSGEHVIAFADTLGPEGGHENQWELYSYFVGNREPEDLPPLVDLKAHDWGKLEGTLKSLGFEQYDGPAKDMFEREPIPTRGVYKSAEDVEIIDMEFDGVVMGQYGAIAVLRYIRVLPTPEFWEVMVCQEVEEGTGVILVEELCRPPQRQTMTEVYTNNTEGIEEWFVTSELPLVPGPTWPDVQTQIPDVVEPKFEAEVEFNPEELPPGGGVIYIRLVKEVPVVADIFLLELTEQRITHTFSLIDIFKEYGEGDIDKYWKGSDSWFLRPSISPKIESVEHYYAYDFNLVEESNPDNVGCPDISESSQSLVTYVRQASFRSKSWVDLTYFVQYMNRSIPKGYVIGAVEYADGGDWGVQMVENEATDTASPSRPEEQEIITATERALSREVGRYESFYRGARFSRLAIPSGGLRYRAEYQNRVQGNPKHGTEGDTLVPRFYFTVYRESNLPLINHWAYVIDGDERLKIGDASSSTGGFHKLQDGINKEVQVGGRSKSARSEWYVPRTNVSLKDSRGVGVPSTTFSERIREMGVPYYYIRDTLGIVELEFSSDGDPEIPIGDTPYKLPDLPRYSPEQDDRVIFEWDVVSEHWHVSEWEHGPNGGGTNYGTGGPTNTGTDWVVERSKSECIAWEGGECVKTGTCTRTWNYSHDYGLQIARVTAGEPDGIPHEDIFIESSENQNGNRGYFEWVSSSNFNAFSDDEEKFNDLQRPDRARRRLSGLARTGPGTSPNLPSGAEDAEGDPDTGRYGVVQERIVLNTSLIRYAFDMQVFRHQSTPNIGKQTPTAPPESQWVGKGLQGLNQVGTNPWRRKVNDGRSWGFVKVNEPLEFYTYIEMLYDTVQDNQALYGHGGEIFVFSESLATLHLHDSVEIAWDNRNPSRSINFESNQWSGHARVSWLELRGLGKSAPSPANIPVTALQQSDMSNWYVGANKRVLPGGALFRTLHDKDNYVTFGLRTWQTFVQDDVRGLLGEYMPSIGRDNLNFQGTIDHHRSLVGNFSQAGGVGLINQSGARYVNLYVNGRVVGPDVSGPQRSNKPLEGLTLNDASRYWRTTELNSNEIQSSRVTPINRKEDHTAFRMVARVDGGVALERKDLGSAPSSPKGYATADGWSVVQEWKKEQFYHLGTEERATLSGIAREIDLNTGLISGFFQALNRNQGDDSTSTMEYAPKWYNQAFRGIGVIVSETKWDYNIWNEAGGGYRMQALDPRLTPNNNHGQVGMFTRAFPADARINAFTYQIGGTGEGGFRSASVPKFGRDGRGTTDLALADRPNNNTDYGGWLQGNDGNMSNRFFIPNATVQDLR